MVEAKGEYGPDFLRSISSRDVVFRSMVKLLAQRGYAVSLCQNSKDPEKLDINASTHARQVIEKTVETSEFIVLQGAFRSFLAPRETLSIFDLIDSCYWDPRIKQRVLAQYEYKVLLDRGYPEEEALLQSRRFAPTRINREEIAPLLSGVILGVESQVGLKNRPFNSTSA